MTSCWPPRCMCVSTLRHSSGRQVRKTKAVITCNFMASVPVHADTAALILNLGTRRKCFIKPHRYPLLGQHSGPRRFMGKEKFSWSYKNSNPGPSSPYTSRYAALAPSVLLSRLGNKLKQQHSLTCAYTRNSKPCRIAHKPGEVQLYQWFFSSNGGEKTWKFKPFVSSAANLSSFPLSL
jgi:hypothetical protein